MVLFSKHQKRFGGGHTVCYLEIDPYVPYGMPNGYGCPSDKLSPEWPDQETLDAQYESYGLHGACEPPSRTTRS